MTERAENTPRPTTHLEFVQAMKDFTTMFPEMDRDVIEEVLRANQGAVDATIDQLLAMTTDNLNEALRLDLEKTDNTPDVTKHCMSPLRVAKNWAPPHLGPLPPTFLRLTNGDGVDYGEDERLAYLLQNDEFLSELQINEDFLSALDGDLGERGGNDVDAFKERLKHMGKGFDVVLLIIFIFYLIAVSKNKFTQLARVFQRGKKRSGKNLLEQGSSDGLLSSESLESK